MSIQDNSKKPETAEPTRREAIETLGRVAAYVAPATLMLVSSVSAAGSVQ